MPSTLITENRRLRREPRRSCGELGWTPRLIKHQTPAPGAQISGNLLRLRHRSLILSPVFFLSQSSDALLPTVSFLLPSARSLLFAFLAPHDRPTTHPRSISLHSLLHQFLLRRRVEGADGGNDKSTRPSRRPGDCDSALDSASLASSPDDPLFPRKPDCNTPTIRSNLRLPFVD